MCLCLNWIIIDFVNFCICVNLVINLNEVFVFDFCIFWFYNVVGFDDNVFFKGDIFWFGGVEIFGVCVDMCLFVDDVVMIN